MLDDFWGHARCGKSYWCGSWTRSSFIRKCCINHSLHIKSETRFKKMSVMGIPQPFVSPVSMEFRWSGIPNNSICQLSWPFIHFFGTLILSFYHSHSPTDSCMFFCHCCRNCPPCPHNMSNKANENTPILQPTIKKENDGQYPLWVHKGYPKNCMPKQNRHNIFLSLGPLSYPSRYAARLPPSLGHKTREVLPVALWCVRVILADDVGVPLLDHLYIHWFWHHRCWEIPHAVDCFLL